MNKLYIIGNGFDLHHKLDTSYRSFGLFLKDKYTTIYDLLLEYYGFSELNNFSASSDCNYLWREFEESLSLLDSDMVLDAYSDSLANPGSPEFRDRDWGAFAIDIEGIVESLTIDLFKAFREFIISVKYPPLQPNLKIDVDNAAMFLTFNYTDTLERYYGIPEKNITYIHGKAGTDEDLILGHGIDPKEFEDKPPVVPENLDSEQFNEWQEQMADSYDHSLNLGRQELHNYFLRTFKQTEDIIASNSSFFNSIRGVDKVFVLGHSLSVIDRPYINAVIKSVKESSTFVVSYYSDEGDCSHKSELLGLGVSDIYIELKKLDEI